jgi:hypothetical protein
MKTSVGFLFTGKCVNAKRMIARLALTSYDACTFYFSFFFPSFLFFFSSFSSYFASETVASMPLSKGIPPLFE